MARAIDEALAEPAGTPPESNAEMVKVARRTVAEMVRAARRHGPPEAALREHLAAHTSEIQKTMEKTPIGGLSASLIEESRDGYRQAIAEALRPEDPSVSQEPRS